MLEVDKRRGVRANKVVIIPTAKSGESNFFFLKKGIKILNIGFSNDDELVLKKRTKISSFGSSKTPWHINNAMHLKIN